MEFDFSWLLWGLPLAFVLGWLASRLDLRQLRIENRQAPKAYFKGLNFLLNEQQDQAIDAFIEAVRNDPETSELHFALGNLFRKRGEYERAVRVHEHLLARGDLSREDRHRAQHALALDFLKAGLLDRAEEALRKLHGTTHEAQALLALLAIYERTRDWEGAIETASRLDASGHGDFSGRLAHYLCEQASQGPLADAEALLRRARTTSPGTARPGLDLAILQMRGGQAAAALETLTSLARDVPQSMGLIAKPLAEAAIACGQQTTIRSLLIEQLSQASSLDVTDAVALLEPHEKDRQKWYLRHLQREPSLVAAARWLTDEPHADPEVQPFVQRALDHAAKPLARYRCAACGFEANRHFWQCPGCQAWDSYPARRVEEL